ISCQSTELEEVWMGIVVALDVHREQITYKVLDRDSGELRRDIRSRDRNPYMCVAAAFRSAPASITATRRALPSTRAALKPAAPPPTTTTSYLGISMRSRSQSKWRVLVGDEHE